MPEIDCWLVYTGAHIHTDIQQRERQRECVEIAFAFVWLKSLCYQTDPFQLVIP